VLISNKGNQKLHNGFIYKFAVAIPAGLEPATSRFIIYEH